MLTIAFTIITKLFNILIVKILEMKKIKNTYINSFGGATSIGFGSLKFSRFCTESLTVGFGTPTLRKPNNHNVFKLSCNINWNITFQSYLWVMNTDNISVLIFQIAWRTVKRYWHCRYLRIVKRSVRKFIRLFREPQGAVCTENLLFNNKSFKLDFC